MRQHPRHTDGFLRPPSANLTQSSLLLTIGTSLGLLAAAGLMVITLSDPLMDRIRLTQSALCESNLTSFCTETAE
ncbi:MAG: hypothetical protein H6905_00910 [Hyphomicrobiales bacterium]|nr:hypothetical protein [Hyphomicrobiales bacterium]